MESQPQNPEFRINPENFHQCTNAGINSNATMNAIAIFEQNLLLFYKINPFKPNEHSYPYQEDKPFFNFRGVTVSKQ